MLEVLQHLVGVLREKRLVGPEIAAGFEHELRAALLDVAQRALEIGRREYLVLRHREAEAAKHVHGADAVELEELHRTAGSEHGHARVAEEIGGRASAYLVEHDKVGVVGRGDCIVHLVHDAVTHAARVLTGNGDLDRVAFALKTRDEAEGVTGQTVEQQPHSDGPSLAPRARAARHTSV